MNAEALAASKAYLNASNPASAAAGAAEQTARTDFGEMVAEAMENVVQSGRQTEAQIAQAVTGQGDMVNVVTAIAETELAPETMVTVRDRVISAYQEIMNMPI